MAVSKFKINHADLPSNILKDHEGTLVLHLRLATLTGRREVMVRDGDVIRTEDPFIKAQLANYSAPRIPIKRIPSGETTAVASHYDHAEYKDKKPFASVAANTTHHIEL